MDHSPGGNRIVPWRLWATLTLLGVVLVIFVVRLYQLQVLEGAYYEA